MVGPCCGVQGGWVSLCRVSGGWRGAGQGAECSGTTGRQCSSLFCRLGTCMGLAGRCLPGVLEASTLRCWLCSVSVIPPGRWCTLVKLQLTGHPPGAAAQALRLVGTGCGWLPADQLRHPAGAGAGRSEWHHPRPASAAGAPASRRTEPCSRCWPPAGLYPGAPLSIHTTQRSAACHASARWQQPCCIVSTPHRLRHPAHAVRVGLKTYS